VNTSHRGKLTFGFKGDSEAEQELRIKFMKQQMHAILGERAKEATGFRAPTESSLSTWRSILP
jgi:hypothetical protein